MLRNGIKHFKKISQSPNPLIPQSPNPPIHQSPIHFSLGATDRQTDRQGDGQTDKQELLYLDRVPSSWDSVNKKGRSLTMPGLSKQVKLFSCCCFYNAMGLHNMMLYYCMLLKLAHIFNCTFEKS